MLGNWFGEGHARARVVAHSAHPNSGVPPIATVEVEFPRPYLAEFNTHGRLARSSASSRAIPVWKRLRDILDRPYVPTAFGKNKGGMQSAEMLGSDELERAYGLWRIGSGCAVAQAFALAGGRVAILAETKNDPAAVALCDRVEALVDQVPEMQLFRPLSTAVHKQHANRVIEPYAYHTVVTTATHWRNYFALRASKDAQPEAQDFGIAIARALKQSVPMQLSEDGWHLPYVFEEEYVPCVGNFDDMLDLGHISGARCGRVSYLTHDGVRSLDKDRDMAYNKLLVSGHMSPFMHPARPRQSTDPDGSSGCYAQGWTQLRKLMPNEDDFSKIVSPEDLLIGCRGDQELVDFILSLPA